LKFVDLPPEFFARFGNFSRNNAYKMSKPTRLGPVFKDFAFHSNRLANPPDDKSLENGC
jgi:hypothetical protein